ncbi:flagellar transcriptional regulator FlhC [Ramlibacter alkalitolerans]|uniref:Flagellar transcriptional regulator FlhC n=1 Tax=Ramlibacter alkalitolerans TaxID=2039631 RepID=A0ABS1JM55_9BURK|nr:flagellar transcriptional regulator FlhC [Ramlibacter alkalitolerans]MBL0424875.1 flagellar transcriptional regulator FlhC [Ramlibacter alkalitolerans]
MNTKSLLQENLQLTRAAQLIRLGARLAVLESETTLSHERLVRLYREITGQSPSKGQLPYSTDWYTSWQPNIHASLYMNIHDSLDKSIALECLDLLANAWELYQAEARAMDAEPILTVTRAWRLVKFVESDMLCLTPCTRCGGRFITHSHEYGRGFPPFVCGLCEPPARAGKSKRSGAIH